MKKITIILAIVLFAITKCAYTQVNADAGPDKFVCVYINGIDSITIGGSPSAIGGTSPYTYKWEASYIYNIGNNSYNFTASYFLNDTTIANPIVRSAIGDTIQFRLTITDSENNTAIDSTNVHFVYFGTHLGNKHYTINQGDSVFLYGFENIWGGIPPLEYLWRPNHGLSDSTSLAFWAKPEYSISYYLTLEDSVGCYVIGAPVYIISVIPVNVEEFDNQNSIVEIYPNPVSNFLNVKIDCKSQNEFIFRLFLSTGKLVFEKKFYKNEFEVNLSTFPTGIYLYEVTNNKNISEKGQIIKK